MREHRKRDIITKRRPQKSRLEVTGLKGLQREVEVSESKEVAGLLRRVWVTEMECQRWLGI